jgi:hypothetical protein
LRKKFDVSTALRRSEKKPQRLKPASAPGRQFWIFDFGFWVQAHINFRF